ncbi:unnamed protein product [Didymodactylos carnosus]|uniref:Superkiller viralicidic activity 2-like 2 n=1 Tax=Didymodactylos carnosus TaxID=1234261 RepID=A0A813RM69_9BILA|nr:unnamed protein product [Didymodactylos carnosus]CAF1111792.1 unnamed protein product [Didymodactylos carnosus]CAF3566319.1 unnamed protein product [Didymodactylos carnosus]CAF3879994.1 unnamed protein product [Didymodactylos carnosus]
MSDNALFDVFEQEPSEIIIDENESTAVASTRSITIVKEKTITTCVTTVVDPTTDEQKESQKFLDDLNDEGLLGNSPEKRPNEDDDDYGENTKRIRAELLAETGSFFENIPRMKIHTVETIESCLHEVVLPPNSEYAPLKALVGQPAKEYKFPLDPFQREALRCLQNNQSVLVSAHTSAGKTVVAEYAVAMALRDRQRVIYTTPIKALSNQKFRELHEEFKDVGLMTGDVTINPSASCLIMTTEILRSMLYRGSEITREVAWVIFDEIHYLRDKERGVIWEETIILLPDNVHYVFLSATVPNARQFAEWISFLHNQPCHVVYTDMRPVPLHHYIYPAGAEGLHLVVDETGKFREDNFSSAMATLRDVGDAAKGDKRGKRGGFKSDTNCFKIVKMIMERNLAPVIVFSFSKKDCEQFALATAKLDFNSEDEKRLVEEVFNNAIDLLSDEDKKLPQILSVLPLLRKGIGIHHSGLLPIIKETIEILFGEGLIKALFATETFAMGLNMPARTVLFTAARKFDGKELRWITSGEYIQMSGRAGRRGKDERGIVILIIDERMSPTTAKEIVKGKADALNSAFKLTYNMVLNLLRVEGINPEFMLERSFYQFQHFSSIPGLYEKLKSCEKQYDALAIDREEEVARYYKLKKKLESVQDQMSVMISEPKYLLPFLQPGRLVTVKCGNLNFDWCVVLNFHKKPGEKPTYVIDVLAHLTCESAAQKLTADLQPCPLNEKGEMKAIPIQHILIRDVSTMRVYLPDDLRSKEARQSVLKSLQEIKRRNPYGLPLLDPVKDMGIKSADMQSCVKQMTSLQTRLNDHPLNKDINLKQLYDLYEKKANLEKQVLEAKAELKKARSLLQIGDLKRFKRVLRRLGYCSSSDVIDMKGRVACEIDTGDELVLTELLFNGVFNDLNVSQACALLSCFVFQEKANEMPKLPQELSGPLRLMQETARRVARVSIESKIDMDEERYVDSFKPYMMDVIKAWVDGQNFSSICKMTTIFEGSIIRCIRRLEELLRQMCCAAKAIGNSELEAKFTEGTQKIKRDIVFAASLYL